MNKALDNLQQALQRGMAVRPKVGGFPYLAESLRQAGVTQNIWTLPACQSLFLTLEGPVAILGEPLAAGMVEVAAFDREALISALRADQSGERTFSEFLRATWSAGVIKYEVDFIARICTYYGSGGEIYAESYAAVNL